MKSARRVAALCFTLVVLTVACGPPDALRDRVGQGDNGTRTDAHPPPEPPEPPAETRIGAVVLTNDSSWGILLERGRERAGALVLEVIPDSPAENAGLVVGDVVETIDGTTVHNHEQLLVAFRTAQTSSHTLGVLRADGSEEQLEVATITPDNFSILSYLELKLQEAPEPITRYLVAENLPDEARAIELARGLVAEHPAFAEGHGLLARRLIERVERITGGGTGNAADPDLLDATVAIDTAVELDPQSAGLRRTRAQMLLSLGDSNRAELDADRALELDEHSAEGHYLLGTARFSLGREDDALAPLHRAVQLDPYVVDYYVNLALCYRVLEREADARATFTAALNLANDPGTQRRLNELIDAGPIPGGQEL